MLNISVIICHMKNSRVQVEQLHDIIVINIVFSLKMLIFFCQKSLFLGDRYFWVLCPCDYLILTS